MAQNTKDFEDRDILYTYIGLFIVEQIRTVQSYQKTEKTILSSKSKSTLKSASISIDSLIDNSNIITVYRQSPICLDFRG